MSGGLRSIRGVHDALPDEVQGWLAIEAAARDVFQRHACREVRLPVLEPVELFVRSIGEETDIVSKEMYAFTDQGGDHICLRPEGTAGAVRAWMQAGLSRAGRQRWYYIGPMFRRERPQKGRLRQFNQIGVEWFGAPGPLEDAELLAMAAAFLQRIGVRDTRMEINSLGCGACRPAYREALVAWLKARADALCEVCAARIERNPLRVLDCKVESCREALRDAPEMIDRLCADCAAHFDALRAGLDALNVPFVVNGRIVRGLDYYNRTAFEVVTDRLGAQGTVLAGGRYDGLVRALGGPETPAIGFAAGLERLAMLAGEARWPAPQVALVALGEEAKLPSLALAAELRDAGLSVAHCGGGGAKRQFKQADREGARLVVVLGEDELREGRATLRDMASGEQQTVAREALPGRIRELLAGAA